MANVFDGLRLERRVPREYQLGVGALELGIFEHTNMKGFRALSLKLDAIRQVGVDRLDVAGERWVFQAAGHATLRRLLGLVLDDQVRLGGDAPLETGDDEQRRAAFDLGVAGIDLNVGGARLGENGRAKFRLRTGLAGQGDDNGDQDAEGRRMGQLRDAELPGGHRFVPVIRATVVEGLANDGGLQETEPAGRCGRVFLDRGQQAGPSSGCLASMRRATQRESRTDRRATSAHAEPTAR